MKVKVNRDALLKIAVKVLKYARGGFTEEELLELAADILELAADRASEGG